MLHFEYQPSASLPWWLVRILDGHPVCETRRDETRLDKAHLKSQTKSNDVNSRWFSVIVVEHQPEMTDWLRGLDLTTMPCLTKHKNRSLKSLNPNPSSTAQNTIHAWASTPNTRIDLQAFPIRTEIVPSHSCEPSMEQSNRFASKQRKTMVPR